MLLVGWMVQLACGVAFWILPRLNATGDRGVEWPAWVCYGALNGGVLTLALRDPLDWALPAVVFDRLSVLAAVLYVVAIGAFTVHAWRRVVPFRVVARP
jgi:hypothetical protein